MKLVVEISDEERELLSFFFLKSQINAAAHLMFKNGFARYIQSIFTYAFTKGWIKKLRPGADNLIIKGRAELRMFVRLLKEAVYSVQTEQIADIEASSDDPEVKWSKKGRINYEFLLMQAVVDRIEKRGSLP
jgi:hypothetical protein